MKISFIFGTRPEAIKLAPVILAARTHAGFTPHVCVTAQHREMLDQVLTTFGIVADVDLELMRPDQTLASLTARAVEAIDGYLAVERPDLVVIQGDTTTVLSAALAAFYRRIAVAHVEAGLRTGDLMRPFPEEGNRVLASRLTDFHFAPTAWARGNLMREGVARDRIFVTGNTVIDALLRAVDKVNESPPEIPGLSPEVAHGRRPLVLVTGHRRESFGSGFADICAAIAALAASHPQTDFVYPVHLNPNVREPVFRLLGARANVHLIEPLSYLPFVALMMRARVILTDSGGVQEEGPSLGVPVLVMRDKTERPEGVEAGTVALVGTDRGRIERAVAELLVDSDDYRRMRRRANPYGDGTAAARILAVLDEHRAAIVRPR